MIRRTTILTAGLLLGASLLTGCGSDTKASSTSTPGGSATTADSTGGSTSDYCSLLKTSSKDISGFTSATGSPDFDKFNLVVDEVKKIAAAAPAEVAPSWATLASALTTLTDALTAAGTNLKDVVTAAATGKLPDGVTQEELLTLSSKLGSLQGADITKAGETITAQAKSACGVDLK